MVPELAPIPCERSGMRSHPSRDGGPWASGLAQEAPAPVRPSVKDVAHALRERIASHTIPPGACLREWDVATDFAIPRLTAREALEALVHLGFVERQPNCGIVVRRRELAEVLRLFEGPTRLCFCGAGPAERPSGGNR
jgi:hypothetical protein